MFWVVAIVVVLVGGYVLWQLRSQALVALKADVSALVLEVEKNVTSAKLSDLLTAVKKHL